jgi:nucleoside-triphosphatase THEP1
MIYIVTGKVNSGKTSKLAVMYQYDRLGDGFVAIKDMDNGIVTAYHAMHLSTMETRSFIVREACAPAGFDGCFTIGPFIISKTGLAWIESQVRLMIAKGISPIYLDEIGPLELANGGLHLLFAELVASGLDLYVAIRNELVSQVIEKYHIKEYRLM